MQTRLFITGGTIDKSYNMQNGSLHFVDSHIPSMLARGRQYPGLEIETLMLLDSLDMTDQDRLAIVSACRECTESRIVITHGTDTMVETARLLQQMIADKTIVMTGAMIPWVFNDSDALFNLGGALSAVQCLEPGAYIVMNGRVFSADNVVKNREAGVFETIS